MREYVKNEDVVCIDNVISQTDFGEMKPDYMKDIADAASRYSSLATCVEDLKCDMTTVFNRMTALQIAIESIKNKEKRNGF